MHSNYLKLPAWLIVLWLISLQILAPFVHAHLEADGVHHASVMHLHTAASPAHHAHDTNPVLENPHGPHQIVSVAEGIPKKIEPSNWLDLLPALFIALFAPLLTVFVSGFQYQSKFFPFFRHRSPQPHAPPCF
ncbi:MAG: hypothetical protein CVU15_05695 [Betaproteobacteria bacterium HGW-Betaproteobacteria-1]|jgi:hypothetical protein|nr:MAG: hypothetical protein CVU15_05695 [Betaproteobacteria bacterium HGW-Betaproteobacteria-1]